MASAYGLDLSVWGPISLAAELDIALGTDGSYDVFAAAASPVLALDFTPFTMTLGMRFGLNPFGRELYGPAALLIGLRVSL